MSQAFSAVNEIGTTAVFTLTTGSLATGSELENAAHQHGFVSAKIDPSGGSVVFDVDLAISASHDAIFISTNIVKGTVSIETQTGGGGFIETLSPGSAFPFTAIAPNRGRWVKPTQAFQKVEVTITTATGDIDPVEVYNLWVADDIVEIQEPVRPFDRGYVEIVQRVGDRARPLTSRVRQIFNFERMSFADLTDLLEVWRRSSYGCNALVNFDAWHNAGPESCFIMYPNPPQIRYIRLPADTFSASMEFLQVPHETYPDQLTLSTF